MNQRTLPPPHLPHRPPLPPLLPWETDLDGNVDIVVTGGLEGELLDRELVPLAGV